MFRKHRFKLEFYFTIVIFAIMTGSVIILAPFFLLARSRGFFNSLDIIMTAAILYSFSIIAGVTISAMVGKRILDPIKRFSEAAKKVAGGDFSVRLEEKSRVNELSQMAKDFNLMAQELGKTVTFREDFIANISHEFKTPLASIEGYATLLRDTSPTEEERFQYADKIYNSSHRLSQLSGNILKISTLEGQKIITDKVKFRLDEQIRQAMLMLESQWSKKNLGLDIVLSEIVYFGNRDLLMHVWTNIIGNAVKFTEDGGNITVILKEIDGMAQCVIRDTGIGMNEDAVKHAFDKFYQADNSGKREGNGLGLPLAEKVVKLCGGEINLSSKIDVGTEITVSLPLRVKL